MTTNEPNTPGYEFLADELMKRDAEIERLRGIEQFVSEASRHERDGLRAEIERLRAALQQLVTDYQDVPDPTDADGQAVFEEARRALEPKP